jgi:hypothetical protein
MNNKTEPTVRCTPEEIDALQEKMQALVQGLHQQDVAEVAGRLLDQASCKHVIWTRENFLQAARGRFTDERNIEDAADYIEVWTKHGLTDATAGFALIESVLWDFVPEHEE